MLILPMPTYEYECQKCGHRFELLQSIKDKPVPVWNWPQYASVGVRNSSFANVDPATEQDAAFASGYCAQKITLGVHDAERGRVGQVLLPDGERGANALLEKLFVHLHAFRRQHTDIDF